jgi:hypothetical protein
MLPVVQDLLSAPRHGCKRILGPMLLIGTGIGVVPCRRPRCPGVGGGRRVQMVNVMQQVGGSLGLAVLVTAFSSATKAAAAHPVAALSRLAQAQLTVVHGVSSAFTLAAILDVLALLVVLTVMRAKPAEKDSLSRAVANK